MYAWDYTDYTYCGTVMPSKSNHKVPVQVQVEPFFSGFGLFLVWSWSGESFKTLAQVLAEIF